MISFRICLLLLCMSCVAISFDPDCWKRKPNCDWDDGCKQECFCVKLPDDLCTRYCGIISNGGCNSQCPRPVWDCQKFPSLPWCYKISRFHCPDAYNWAPCHQYCKGLPMKKAGSFDVKLLGNDLSTFPRRISQAQEHSQLEIIDDSSLEP